MIRENIKLIDDSLTEKRVEETLEKVIQDDAYKERIKCFHNKKLICECFYLEKKFHVCNTHFKYFTGKMKPNFEKGQDRGGYLHYQVFASQGYREISLRRTS